MIHQPILASATFPKRLLAQALRSGRDPRRRRAQRHDGWTPCRIRTFLDVLARTGSAAKAARAAGMSRQSAYALRASAKGQAFADAWKRALLAAAPTIPDELMERALNGAVEPIVRRGKVRGERHRFDNRLSMQLLRRLDRIATSQAPAARLLRAVQTEFETFSGIAASGDEEALSAFLRRCCPVGNVVARSANLSSLGELSSAARNAGSTATKLVAESRNLSSLPEHKSNALDRATLHHPSSPRRRESRFFCCARQAAGLPLSRE